jgi:hypothetical protein
MVIKYINILLQDPPKFTQIWIFGSKKFHLATLPQTKETNQNV